MVVCFCLNNLGALGLGATLKSLIKNCSYPSKIRFYFLCSGLDKNVKQAIIALLGELEFDGRLDFIDFDAFHEFGCYKSLHNDWTTYGRLLIPELIDEEKVLYLDTDLVVETNIYKLYNVDMGHFAIAAVASAPIEYSLEHKFFIQTLNIQPGLKTLNAGVLLINVKEWKTGNIKSELLEIGNSYPQELLSADQALLNAFFAGNFFELPEMYNRHWHADSKPIEISVIFHFIGSPKPWDFVGKYVHTGYAKWKTYNTSGWQREVMNKFRSQQVKRCWSIRKSYLKILFKK